MYKIILSLLLCYCYSYGENIMPKSAYNRFFVEYISSDAYDRTKHFDFIECGQLKSVPGIIKEIVGEDCYCLTSKESKELYQFPFLQSPKDPTYPCSPKMLEYFAMQQKMREFRCNQFIKNWNANKYPCIFDKDSKKVEECSKRLKERYCK